MYFRSRKYFQITPPKELYNLHSHQCVQVIFLSFLLSLPKPNIIFSSFASLMVERFFLYFVLTSSSVQTIKKRRAHVSSGLRLHLASGRHRNFPHSVKFCSLWACGDQGTRVYLRDVAGSVPTTLIKLISQ